MMNEIIDDIESGKLVTVITKDPIGVSIKIRDNLGVDTSIINDYYQIDSGALCKLIAKEASGKDEDYIDNYWEENLATHYQCLSEFLEEEIENSHVIILVNIYEFDEDYLPSFLALIRGLQCRKSEQVGLRNIGWVLVSNEAIKPYSTITPFNIGEVYRLND